MTTATDVILEVALAILALTIVSCFVRLVRGPTFADRVLAADLATIAGTGLLAVAGVRFDDDVFLDVALILIVSGFVSTAAFAALIGRAEARGTEGSDA